jgi:hypothetical protein
MKEETNMFEKCKETLKFLSVPPASENLPGASQAANIIGNKKKQVQRAFQDINVEFDWFRANINSNDFDEHFKHLEKIMKKIIRIYEVVNESEIFKARTFDERFDKVKNEFNEIFAHLSNLNFF